MSANTKRIRMLISGRVQGVFYRAYTLEEARRLGLRGWVRNLHDGRVEVLAEGDPEKLKALEAWCWEGPPYARIHDIKVWEETLTDGEFTSFDVIYSSFR